MSVSENMHVCVGAAGVAKMDRTSIGRFVDCWDDDE